MGSPPSEPGVHQQKKVSLSGDLQPSLSGFSGGDMPGNTRDKETSASNKQYDKKNFAQLFKGQHSLISGK